MQRHSHESRRPPQGMYQKVEYINKPNYNRIVGLWMRLGMIAGIVIALGIGATQGIIESLLAELIIPGLGEALMCVFLLIGAVIVGMGIVAGMGIGSIHYAIAITRYNMNERDNL